MRADLIPVRPMGATPCGTDAAVQHANRLADVILGAHGAATVADDRTDLELVATLPLKPLQRQSMTELLTFALAQDQYDVEVIQSGLPSPEKTWVAYATDGERGTSAYGRTRRGAIVACLASLASDRQGAK